MYADICNNFGCTDVQLSTGAEPGRYT